jgi:hypothetical protein
MPLLMRLFQIDMDRLALLLLPTFVRTVTVYVAVRAMLQPIATLLDKFNKNRESNLYNIGHNGQECKLRAMLNDVFDPVQRRITIEDTDRYEFTFVYREAADRPVWLNTVEVASEGYTSFIATDFTVTVPQGIPRSVRPQMISLINYYKLTGIRYSIKFE